MVLEHQKKEFLSCKLFDLLTYILSYMRENVNRQNSSKYERKDI